MAFFRRISLKIILPALFLGAALVYLMLEGWPSSASPEVSPPPVPRNTIAEFVRRNLEAGKAPNRLIQEKSPFLLQHAFNPVDWYPWGAEALTRAGQENKPIFLLVGYSTCYWCHLMEREVFANPEIAQIMNEFFVNIIVDREELPEVNRTFMRALNAMTGKSGWPISIFLTPDLKPFYGGTYFPPVSKYDLPPFGELLKRIAFMWGKRRPQVIKEADRIGEHLYKSTAVVDSPRDAGEEALRRGFQAYARAYEPRYGGFTRGRKFPRTATFNFLLRHYHQTGNKQALAMVLSTLRRMAEGGIHDHLGGGFHRYTIDPRWQVPHFEKMLPDQALMAISYLEAYQLSGDAFYAGMARDILGYVRRCMLHPQGGFYSGEDAESSLDPALPEKKAEGAFYLWEKREIEKHLSASESEAFCAYYNIQEEGNVRYDPHDQFTGQNVLYVTDTPEAVAQRLNISVEDLQHLLAESCRKLLRVREQRPHPILDDRIITAWNGLMISAFSRAYSVLGDSAYLSAASRGADFLLTHLYDPERKVLLRRYRDGEARFEGELRDYAFLIQGLVDLYEASVDPGRLKAAIALTEEMNRRFYDPVQGGYYDAPRSLAPVLPQSKETYDGAEPSGNAVAVMNLLRLVGITGRKDWQEMAETTLRLFGQRMLTHPISMPQMLVALQFSLNVPRQVIIVGSPDDPGARQLLRAVQELFGPHRVLLFLDGGAADDFLAGYQSFYATLRPLDGKPTAYVGRNFTVESSTTEPAALPRLLY